MMQETRQNGANILTKRQTVSVLALKRRSEKKGAKKQNCPKGAKRGERFSHTHIHDKLYIFVTQRKGRREKCGRRERWRRMGDARAHKPVVWPVGRDEEADDDDDDDDDGWLWYEGKQQYEPEFKNYKPSHFYTIEEGRRTNTEERGMLYNWEKR